MSSPPLPTDAAQDATGDATNYIFFNDHDALVLSGGGARGAYQVGVLKAIAEWLPADAPCPFEVLVGTSAGALNAAAIGARAHSLREAVAIARGGLVQLPGRAGHAGQFADDAAVRAALDGLAALGRLDRQAPALAVRHHAAAPAACTSRAPGADSRADRGGPAAARSPSRRRVTRPGRPSRSSTGPTTSRTGTACAAPGAGVTSTSTC